MLRSWASLAAGGVRAGMRAARANQRLCPSSIMTMVDVTAVTLGAFMPATAKELRMRRMAFVDGAVFMVGLCGGGW